MANGHTYTQKGEPFYSDLIDKNLGMVYVSDIEDRYQREPDGPDDSEYKYTSHTVNFRVPTDTDMLLVTAFHSTQGSWKQLFTSYKGYVLTPNVLYMKTTNKWHRMEEPTLDKAIEARDIPLVDELLNYPEYFTKGFLASKIVELLPQTPRNKRRKGKLE